MELPPVSSTLHWSLMELAVDSVMWRIGGEGGTMQ